MPCLLEHMELRTVRSCFIYKQFYCSNNEPNSVSICQGSNKSSLSQNTNTKIWKQLQVVNFQTRWSNWLIRGSYTNYWESQQSAHRGFHWYTYKQHAEAQTSFFPFKHCTLHSTQTLEFQSNIKTFQKWQWRAFYQSEKTRTGTQTYSKLLLDKVNGNTGDTPRTCTKLNSCLGEGSQL